MKPKEIAIAVAQRKSQEAAAAAGQSRMLALERKATAAADAMVPQTTQNSVGGADANASLATPLQAAAGQLQRLGQARDTATPGPTQQRSPPRRRKASPPAAPIVTAAIPPLHSIGARAVMSAELSSSPLYALLQDPSAPSRTCALAPIISALEKTPAHELLRSGCSGIDELVNGWLADANSVAVGVPVPTVRPGRPTSPSSAAVVVDPRVLRRSLFQHAAADIAARERAVAFSAQEQRGETLLTPQEIAEVRFGGKIIF